MIVANGAFFAGWLVLGLVGFTAGMVMVSVTNRGLRAVTLDTEVRVAGEMPLPPVSVLPERAQAIEPLAG